MSTLNRQYSLLSISISDCQEILGLGSFTPEDVVDQVFSSEKGFVIPKEAFMANFKRAFEKNINTNSKFAVEDVIIRVYDVCSQGQTSITVDQLGKGIGVFTTKRVQNNPIKDTFFSIDKDLKGVLTETSINAFIADAEKRNVQLGNVRNAIEELRTKVTAFIEKFELTYWALHLYRKHEAVQALVQINNQLSNKLSNATVQNVIPQSIDSIAELARSDVLDSKKEPTARVTFVDPINLRPTKSFSPMVPLKEDAYTPKTVGSLSFIPNQTTSNTVIQRPGALTSFDDFISLRNRLGFQLLQPKETLDAISRSIGHIDSLRFDEFITFFCDLFKGRYENYYEFVESLGKIFQFIDVDGNGMLDIGEFMQAIVHLFGGTETEKISAAFQICDKDGSGFLDMAEIESFLYYTMRMANNKSYKSYTQQDNEELKLIAHATAKDVFFKMDLDNNEKVSFEEFMTWYKGSSDEIDQTEKEGAKAIREARLNELKNKGQVPLSEEERKAREDQLVKEVSDPAVFMKTIEDLRAIVAFERIHIQVAVKLVIDTFPNRNCDFKRFSKFLKELCERSNVTGKENANKIALQLFNLLDSNKNGILDIAEIGTGLGLLCGGNFVEKIRAGYDLYDEDNSGRLDFRETSNFLAGFFKIICKNPPPSLANYSADKLGAILAIKAFEDIGVPLDGVLDFDSFKDWLEFKQ